MVAIFTGAGTGFERGSGSVVGAGGLLGSTALGRGAEQLFLNAASGNLLVSQSDEFLIGLGLDASVARTYNSLGDLSDENGDNWRQSTDRRVYGLTGTANTAGSTVKRVSGDGSVITYSWDATKSAYVTTDGAGAHDRLAFANNSWTWRDGDSQVTETYAINTAGTAWLIAQQTDTDGNSLTFTYTSDKLNRVTTADGSYVQYNWSDNNITEIVTGYTDLATSTAKTLTRTRYGYDAQNRLWTATVDLSPTDNNIADGKTYVTTYTYVGTSKLVASISQSDGSRIDIGYDGSNRVASIAQTAAIGVTRTSTVAYGAGYTTVTDPLGQVTRLDYNGDGSLAKIIMPPAQTGAAAQVTQFGYNASGDLTSVTDALTNPTTYAYDGNGNITTITDRLGNITTRTYGSKNELLTETTTSSDAGSSAVPHTTRYVYDAENHLRYVISPEGRVTEYRYTAAGQLERTIDYPEHLYSAAAPSDPNAPVATASFETPEVGTSYQFNPTVAGMTFTGRAGIAGNGSSWGFAPAPDGDQVAFVQSLSGQTGSISQTISGLSAGTTYALKFFMAGSPGAGPTYVDLSAGGTSLGTFTLVSRSDWEEFTANFTAIGSTITLTFTSSTAVVDGATAIDNVRVVPSTTIASASFETPEVGTGYIMNPTVSGMSFIGRAGIAGNGSSWGFANALDGDQVAFVQSQSGLTGSVSTTLSGLNAGTTYALKFLMAGSPGPGYTFVHLSAGSTSLGTFTPVSRSDWEEFATSFTATGSTVTLTFTSSTAVSDGANAIDNIRIIGPSATGSAEAEINAWRDAIADKSSTQVTVNSYDARGSLAWSESYSIVTAAGAASTSDGFSKTSFVYDQAGNLLSRNAQGRNTETFVYDGMGRLASTVDVNGGTTSYVFDDANTKTIVTLTSGLVQTSTYNKAGELIQFTESAAGAGTGSGGGSAAVSNIAPDLTNPAQWTPTNLSMSPATIGGNPGTQLTVNTGQTTASTATEVAAQSGDTVSIEVALQAGTTNHGTIEIGRIGSANTTGAILSGPGALSMLSTGAWRITNLSATQATVVRVTRTLTYATTTALVSVFVGDNFTGLDNQAGHSLIAGSPNVSRNGSTQSPGLAPAVGTATYGYDQLGRLRWQVDATGRKSYVLYDNVGRKVADVSSAGDIVEYRYDANDRLVATTRFATRLTSTQITNLDNQNSVADISTYRPAGSASDLWSWNVYNKEGQLLQAIAGDGSTAVNSYDGAGRLIRTVSHYNKIAAATLTGFKTTAPTVVTLPTADAARDRVSRTFYDKDGRLLGALDGEGSVSQILYDKAGRKVQEIAFLNATTADRANGTFNQLVAGVVAHAEDRRTRYVYDGQGQLRFVVDAKFQVTESLFDNAGQATTLIAYSTAISSSTTNFSYSNIKTLAAALTVGRRSWSVYDNAGRVAYAINAENGVTAFSYNSSGQVTRAVEFATARSTTTLPSKTDMDTWATSNIANIANRITRNFYDNSGVLRYSVDGEGFVSRMDVDAEGRVIKTLRWANAIAVTDSSTTDTVHTAVASGGGTTVEITNVYDSLGRLQTSTDGEGVIRRYEYDANGLLARDIAAWGTLDEATTKFTYDGAGRLLEQHRGFGTAEVSVTKFAYDGLGNVTSITDPNNKVTTQTFDRLGQVLTRTDALNGVTTFQYDAFGNAVKVTDALGNITFNYYDVLGRLVKTADALKYVTETSYTPFGEIASVTRRYNAATNTPSVTVQPTVTADAIKDAVTSFIYDRLGRTTKVTDAEGKFEQYTLNAFGNRTSVLNKLGGPIANTFDRRGLLLSETLPMASVDRDGNTVASTVTNKFAYDARGNRTQMIEAFGLAEARTTNYAYDKADRLITKSLGAVTTTAFNDFTSTNAVTVTTASVVPTESYVYDKRGNLRQITDALGGRTVLYYNDLNRKTAEVGPLGTLKKCTYDAAGNCLTERVFGDAVTVPTLPSSTPPNPVNANNFRETIYTYDALNRLATTGIASALVGSWNGTGVTTATQTVTSSLTYDANGNVVRTLDANGNAAFSYYDKLGRKTVQVDALNHVTQWTYDAEGNVLTETRYATALGAPPTVGTVPAMPAPNANDRITNFAYDRNGRRLTETRTGVVAWSVSTTNGALTQTATNSVVTYTYNGLGQVLTKAAATGDTVTYTYDQTGRLTKESRVSYTDQASASVTPTVTYSYNGLNNLSRTQQGGATLNASTDRITTYIYGAGGRLASMTDAAGGTHNYGYDAAGNLVQDRYVRLIRTVMGTPVEAEEAILYHRDLLSRVTAQTIAANNAGAWTRGDSQNSEYNAFGDVSRRGVNGLWQESLSYNNRGLVEKSNSGDGVWRFFVYDKNGSQILAIEDENYIPQDLGAKTVADVLDYLGGTAGASFVDGLNTTISIYDKRNQATEVRLPQRELAAGAAGVPIVTSQTYNAFGEIASQTTPGLNAQDSNAAIVSTFVYNTMGRLIQKNLPKVKYTNESGVESSTAVNPTEKYFYDLGGRLVATEDANGNRTSRALLAGTGYGDAEALVVAEHHADGGIARTLYDVFGDARILRNELYNAATHNISVSDETRTYDKMGRLITQAHRGGLLTDNYTYDLLGQRLTHWNSFLGSANMETSEFDLQGRVTKVVAFGGDTTTTSYAWDATIANSGMSAVAYGGWTQTDTYANSRTMIVKTDMFGRDTSKTDLGGHSFTFAYDKAGRQVSRATAGETLTTVWLNSGLAASLSFGASDYQNFTYDERGNRLSETLVRGGTTVQNATAAYDALGRLIAWNEAGGSQTPMASKAIEYDLNGNIRRNLGTYRTFDNIGVIATADTVRDLWFRYDSMNRVVLSDGLLSGGSIVQASDRSAAIQYDAAGRRVAIDRQKTLTAVVYDPWAIDGEGGGARQVSYDGIEREAFVYNNDDTLAQVRTARQGYVDNGDGSASPGDMPATGLVAAFTYDAMKRQTRQLDYLSGSSMGTDRTVTYNAKGQMTYEVTVRKQWDGDSYDTYRDESTFSYGTGTNYALGQITQIDTQAYQVGVSGSDDAAVPDPRTINSYAWYDGAVLSQTSFDKDINDSNTIFTTTYTNSPSGVLSRAVIADNRPREVRFTTDMAGQVIKRDENKKGNFGLYTGLGPTEVWHRFNGREMNYTSNNGAVSTPVDYATSAAKRWAKPSSTTTEMFNGGASANGFAYGDVDASFEGITTGKQGSAARTYTVRGGETLQSIALAVWGDAGYWYKVAEANGLSADSMLFEGQQLSLPAGVTRSSNSAATFKPYDASEAIGDLSPTRVKPPKKKGGGLFGKILLAVIQIALTIVLTVAFAPLGPAAPVAAATVANIATQGIGVVTGLQDKFSWKQVGITAITAGVTAGINAGGVFNFITDATLRAGVTAVASSTISQGVAVVTGLQPKFDWVGVAAAGVGAAAGNVATNALGKQLGLNLNRNEVTGAFENPVHGAIGGGINSAASAIANAATRSVARGTSFGDNLIAALPDAIASTIGGFLEASIAMNQAKRARMAATSAAIGNAGLESGGSMAAAGATGETAGVLIGKNGGKVGGTGSLASPPIPLDPELQQGEIVVTARRRLPDAPHTPVGQAIDFGTFNARLMQWKPWIADNDPTMTLFDYSGVIAGYQNDYEHILKINAAAARDLHTVDMVFGGLMALPATAMGAPLFAGGAGALGLAAGITGTAAGLNQASGISTVFTGSDQLLADQIFYRGASVHLNYAGLGTGLAAGSVSLLSLGRAAKGPLAGSIRTVNPSFPARGFNQNCVECVIATEQRFAGTLGAIARPTAGPLPIARISDQFGGSFQNVSGPMEIGSILSQAGNGSRGIIYGADSARGFGHVWNVRMDNGVVRFLDSQPGQRAGLGVNNFDDFTDFQFLLTSPGRRP